MLSDVERHGIVLGLRGGLELGRELPCALGDVVAGAFAGPDQALGLEQVIGLEHGRRTDSAAGAGLANGGQPVYRTQHAGADGFGELGGQGFIACHEPVIVRYRMGPHTAACRRSENRLETTT